MIFSKTAVDGTSRSPGAGTRPRGPPRLGPEHPARRIAELGSRVLSTRELLCIILDGGRGHAWADAAASRLMPFLAEEGGGLRGLTAMSVPGLAHAASVGMRAAARLHAALELGARAVAEMRPDPVRIRTARDVYNLFTIRMRDLKQEEFHVLLLDTQRTLLRDVTVSVGTVDRTVVHARDVFGPALTERAKTVILAHNHPSGESLPSPEDRILTRSLVSAGALMGIPVDDHVIIGEGRYYSFREEGTLPVG